MATAQPAPTPARHSRRRRVLLIVALLALALLAWFWRPLNGYATAGASYGAHVACSCRFIANRSLADCRKDFEAGMWPIMLSEDAAARSVTARFPLLASQTASYRAGQGCVLEKWED